MVSYSYNLSFGYKVNIAFSVSPVNPSDVFSLQCLLRNHNWKYSFHYFKIIATLLYPFFSMLIFLILKIVFSFLLKTNSFSKIENPINERENFLIKNSKLLVISFNIVVSMVYPDLVKVTLLMFNCENIGDNQILKYKMIEDYSVSCLNSSHFKWSILAATGFISFGIIYPLYLVISLFIFNKRKELNSIQVKFQFGYFYYVYKEKFYYWDILIIFRRLLIIFVNVIYFSATNKKELYPIFTIMFILAFSLILHVENKPFLILFKKIDLIEKISLISLLMTVYFALIILSQHHLSIFWQYLFLITLSLLNLFFFFYFISVLYSTKILISIIHFIISI